MKVAATALLLAGVARIAEGQPSCEATFHSGGTLIARVYSVYVDAPGIPVSEAFNRLTTQLPSKQFEIVGTDPEHGVVKTVGVEMHTTNFDFFASQIGSGCRVKMVMRPRVAVYANSNTKATMCAILTSLLAPPETGSSSDPAGGAAPGPAPAPVAAEPPPFEPQEAPLTNDEIVKLTAAGLPSELIVAKVNQAASETFDVSTDALIALRKKKVAKDVIAAMLLRVADRTKRLKATPG